MDEQEIYPSIDQNLKYIPKLPRYDVTFVRNRGKAKKYMPIETVVKVVKNCEDTGAGLVLRGVFWLNGLLKYSEIWLNFYIEDQWLFETFENYDKRVFCSHEDISRWMAYT